MSVAIDDLKHEHEAILFTLGLLEKMISIIAEGGELGTADPLDLVAFLKEFADKCHHGKEEGILFPAMEAAGIPRENGPIGAMLHEHELGRGYIGAMSAALEGKGDFGRFAAEARHYVDLLRQHIDKENSVLFPMAERLLPAATLEAIYEGFEAHEATVIGKGRHEELHAMLDVFEAKYLGKS